MSLSRIGSSSLCVLLLALACGGKSDDPEPETSGNQRDDAGRETSRDETEEEEDAGPEQSTSEEDAGASGETVTDDEEPDASTTSDETDDPASNETDAQAPSALDAGASEIEDAASTPISPEASVPELPADGGLPSLPEECESSSYNGAGYCSLNAQCGGSSYTYSNCSQNGDYWLCSCSGSNSYGEFEVSDVTASQACETVAALCYEGFRPSFEGPVECQEPNLSAQTEYCYASLPCSRRVDLGNGIVSIENNYRQTDCSQNPETGAWSCYCYDNFGNNSNVVLDDVSSLEACQVSLDLCGSEEEPVPVGEPVCGDYTTSSDVAYCQTARECVQEVTIGETTVGQTTSDGSYCTTNSNGDWDCTCQGTNPSRIRVEVPAELEAEASCEQAADVCILAVDAELTGEIECAIKSQSSSGEVNCYAELECTRDVALEGVVAKGFTNVSVSCNGYGDEWSCSCSDDDESQSLTLPLGETAWNTCTNAASECVGLLELTPGEPYSSGPRPPFPGPIFVDSVAVTSSAAEADKR